MKDFEDKREEPILIGRRYAAFEVPMDDVRSGRAVRAIITDTVKSKLTRHGHSVVAEGEDVVFSGEIRKFWITTDTTPLYWDVIGEVDMVLNVKHPDGTLVITQSYSAKKVERTYAWPSEATLIRVIVASLEDIMRTLSSDDQLVKALKVQKGLP